MTKAAASPILPVTLASIVFGVVGCAAPEPAPVHQRSVRSSVETAGDGADAPGEAAPSASAPAAPAPTTTTHGATIAAAGPPPEIAITFNLAANQTFGGQIIGRACSDRGAQLQDATFLDGTSLRVISVDYPDKQIAYVDGPALDAMKQSLVATGDLAIPVDPKLLPTSPYEFAMIMGGDERFGSPEACGVSLAPTSADERDARNFPNNDVQIFGGKVGGTGCGTVGYLQAYWDASLGKVVAQATSQLLLAAWDGESGFPAMQDRTPCDVNHSPLVLDLGGRGVRIGAPAPDVFDVDGDGVRDGVSWVTSDDTPFLVRDGDRNGRVDGIDELFGNRSRGPTGSRASQNGFEALAQWDSNGDGAIGVGDEVWAELRLWFDRNHDGRTDPGELETLDARGVQSIALAYVPVRQDLWSEGRPRGAVRQRGGATMADGRILAVLDVWFDGGR
jgi:hypothetical protein